MKAFTQIFDAGSRWGISSGKSGVGNMVARTLFKSPAVVQSLQEKGITLDVSIDREHTSFSFVSFEKDFKDVAKIIASALTNPSFEQSVLDAEIAATLSQVQSSDKNTITTEMVHETAFHGSSMAHPILGTPEDIQSITLEDLKEYTDAHLTSDRCAFGTASSSGSNQDTLQIISDLFSSMPKTAKTDLVHLTDRPATDFVGSDFSFAGDNITTATWAYGFESVGVNHADYWTTKVIEKMIGSWSNTSSVRDTMTNNLGRRYFKTQSGYVNNYQGFSFNYCDTGLIGVLASGPFNQMDPAVFLAAAELQRFTRSASMDPQEVTRAKKQLLWELSQFQRTIQGQAYWSAHTDLTYGNVLSLQDISSTLEPITTKQVSKVADDLFYDQDHVLAALIPKEKGYNASTSIDYNQLRSKSHSLRL